MTVSKKINASALIAVLFVSSIAIALPENPEGLVKRVVKKDAAVEEVLPVIYAQAGVDSQGNEKLRFSTPVKVSDSTTLAYTRSVEGVDDKVVEVKSVYKAIEANGVAQYYDGTQIVSEDPQNDYYWANYLIKFNEDSAYKSKMFTITLDVDGKQAPFLTTSYDAVELGNSPVVSFVEDGKLLGRSIVESGNAPVYAGLALTENQVWMSNNVIYDTLPAVTENATFEIVENVFINNSYYLDLNQTSSLIRIAEVENDTITSIKVGEDDISFTQDGANIYVTNYSEFAKDSYKMTLIGENKVYSLNVSVIETGVNLQDGLGTNFERFGSKALPNVWYEDFGNFSSGKVDLVADENNVYAKLLPTANNVASIITKACDVNILNAGTYSLEFDVKVTENTNGVLTFGIFNGIWLPTASNINVDISKVEANTWTKVSTQFVIEENSMSNFANLDLSFVTDNANENNYVLIDNFNIIKDGQVVDNKTNNDFEKYGISLANKLSTSGWKNDDVCDVIYIGTSLENSLVKENNNTIVKAYTSNSNHTDITFAANTEIANAGTYMLSMKVKLGSGAINVDNIGFRFSSNVDLSTGDMVFDKLNTLSSEQWVTLQYVFVIEESQVANYLNIDMWVFTHNDELQSQDNYVLIDDIAICKVII